MITTEFKKLVKEALHRQGLSLRQAAKEADISSSYLSRILSGERDFPSDEAIIRLARVLKIQPPERLLAEAGRVRFSAYRDLTEEQIREVMGIIRSVMDGERRSIARRQRKRRGRA